MDAAKFVEVLLFLIQRQQRSLCEGWVIVLSDSLCLDTREIEWHWMINGQRRGTTNQEIKSEALKLKGANKPSSKRSRREWEDWQNGEKINSVRKEIQMGCVWIIELENKYMVNTKQRWAYHRQYRLECRTHSLNPELEINEFMLKNSPDSASSCRLTARLSIMCGIYI